MRYFPQLPEPTQAFPIDPSEAPRDLNDPLDIATRLGLDFDIRRLLNDPSDE